MPRFNLKYILNEESTCCVCQSAGVATLNERFLGFFSEDVLTSCPHRKKEFIVNRGFKKS